MSLFDILRYSDTNLMSREALLTLPDRLIELYWKHTGPWDTDPSEPINTERCRVLAWYASLHENKDFIQQHFQRALKEYSHESV